MSSPANRDAAFERKIERQTLISEQRRAVILGWTLAGIFVIVVAYVSSFGFGTDILPGRFYTLSVLAFGIALEWLTGRVLAWRIREGREFVPLRAYISATLEVGLPTAIMAIMCHYDHPINVLTSAANYVYFILIILAPLRLDLRLCVYTGGLSAVAYGVLVSVYQQQIAREWLGSPLIMHLSFFMRGVLLLAAGLAAGFVSQRIRATLLETLREEQERERIIDLFGQHVSPSVVNQLLSQPTGQSSELRDVCVMVLDIRNFTTFSEARAADEVVLYLNTLWSFMVRTVNEHDGIVNKFLGDGFLAVFGAPLSTGKDCVNAIEAARRIIQETDELAGKGTLPPTKIGMALHSGRAIVGNIGSAERKEYTVIGDVVNVAFRIEALNKELGSKLLISEPVQRAGGVEAAERIPPMPIRGRRDPVQLFRVA